MCVGWCLQMLNVNVDENEEEGKIFWNEKKKQWIPKMDEAKSW